MLSRNTVVELTHEYIAQKTEEAGKRRRAFVEELCQQFSSGGNIGNRSMQGVSKASSC